MEELYKLLPDVHVAHEESQCPMRGGVEGLGDIKGQDIILLLPPLQSALCREHRCCRRRARHGPELPDWP